LSLHDLSGVRAAGAAPADLSPWSEEGRRFGPVTARLRGVRRIFAGRAVLDGVDLEVRKGEFVALLGPTGTGKTTLLRILAGLDRADEGDVGVAAARSVVFQEPRLVPALRVWRNVVIGHRRSAASRKLAAAALDEVGLVRHADAWPRTLSGGEAQRVALARALVQEPALLLLDEPFAALDALTRIRMHGLVQQLLSLSNRVVVLNGGRVRLDAPVDMPRPRARTDRAFENLRQRLLAKLDVAADEPPI